jgi:hypothetical protein
MAASNAEDEGTGEPAGAEQHNNASTQLGTMPDAPGPTR